MNGLLVIDKPSGMTSRDAVNHVQRWFPRKTKIGHTGTLDPLATGVLVICIGAATRLADYVQAMPKTYVSRFRLGATSTTDDADGTITETPDATPLTREQIDAALASFIGTIEQTPPAYSALKVGGQRAHDLARKGEGFELRARPVRIDTIRVLAYEWPFLDVEIDCGKGTYIRSIARDLGERLGSGGHLAAQRRTEASGLRIDDSLTPDAMERLAADGRLAEAVRPVTDLLDLPRLTLDAADARRFRHGSQVAVADGRPGRHAVLTDTELLGIGSVAAGVLQPVKVIPVGADE
jgi:tRNA pseudouridine55 synthase